MQFIITSMNYSCLIQKMEDILGNPFLLTLPNQKRFLLQSKGISDDIGSRKNYGKLAFLTVTLNVQNVYTVVPEVPLLLEFGSVF